MVSADFGRVTSESAETVHIFVVVGQTPLPPHNRKRGGVHYESYEFTEV